jgi:hypothetical protein
MASSTSAAGQPITAPRCREATWCSSYNSRETTRFACDGQAAVDARRQLDAAARVDDRDYQVPFRFTGKLANLTIKLGPKMPPPELVDMEKKLMERAAQRARGR